MANSDKELDSVKPSNKAGNDRGNESSDLFVGVVTFIVFIIFMTVWMYFSV
jgi:hypothetical protein